MKYTAGLMLASAGLSTALIKDCSADALEEGGNWFCGKVSHILYEGLNVAGSYKAVTNMGDDGSCQTEERTFNGPLGPLSEELSVHIRGPANLAEFAAYNIAAPKKREVAPVHAHSHARRRHGHGHLHQKKADIVTATIDGKVVTWENNWFGGAEPTAAPEAPAEAPAADSSNVVDDIVDGVADAAKKITDSLKTKLKGSAKAGNWQRISYYNAQEGTADGLVFLGNYGGQGSGKFDTVWGNSLSYLNAQGDGGSATPQVLKPGLIPSNREFSLWTDEKCGDDCGFSRAPEVAYRGFGGSNKVMLFKFNMPLDGTEGFNADMSAIWLLNSRISRAGQYSACNCWPECGEFDMYEVLASGDTKCKSTIHMDNGGGSSDWFDRPVNDYIKVALIFDEATASATIRKLDDSVDFSQEITSEDVQSWITGGTDNKTKGLFSLFQLG